MIQTNGLWLWSTLHIYIFSEIIDKYAVDIYLIHEKIQIQIFMALCAIWKLLLTLCLSSGDFQVFLRHLCKGLRSGNQHLSYLTRTKEKYLKISRVFKVKGVFQVFRSLYIKKFRLDFSDISAICTYLHITTYSKKTLKITGTAKTIEFCRKTTVSKM